MFGYALFKLVENLTLFLLGYSFSFCDAVARQGRAIGNNNFLARSYLIWVRYYVAVGIVDKYPIAAFAIMFFC